MLRWLAGAPRATRVLVVGALLCCVAQGPLLYGLARTPPGWRFTGFTSTEPDPAAYLSLVEQSRLGAWAPRVLLTAEQQSHGMVAPLWVALGKVAAALAISSSAAYLMALVLASFLFTLTVDWLAGLVGFSPPWRWVALATTCLGSGLGWLYGAAAIFAPSSGWAATLRNVFVDWHYTGFSAAANALVSPHLLVAEALSLLILGAYLWHPPRRWLPVAATASVALVVGFVHPYDIIKLGAVYVVLLVAERVASGRWGRGSLARFTALLAGLLPGTAYMLWLLGAEPVYRSWSLQNITASPPLPLALLSYLPLLVLAAAGLARAAATLSGAARRLLIVAATVPLALAYLPLAYQRRMFDGWYVAVGLLAAAGLWRWRRALKPWGVAACCAFVALTPLVRSAAVAAWLAGRPAASYQSPALVRAQLLLEQACRTSPQPLLVDDPYVSLYAPLYTGCTAYYGHRDLTVGYEQKIAATEKFFSDAGMAGEARAAWLAESGVAYVLVTHEGWGGFRPGSVPGLVKVFESGSVTLYAVEEAAKA